MRQIKEIKIWFNEEKQKYDVISDDNSGEFDNCEDEKLFYVMKKIITNKKFKNCFYRGQNNIFAPIPTLLRKNNSHLLQNEKEYINTVKTEHEIELFDLKNDYEVYSKMQHHGCPTRFLDITDNPYKALGFMVEGLSMDENKENSIALYIFKPTENVGKIFLSLRTNEKENIIEKENSFPIIIPSKNQAKNQRAYAQNGHFIYFNGNINGEDEVLECLCKNYDINKIIIKDLNKKNINEIETKLNEYHYGIDKLYPDMNKRAEFYKNKWKK